jgi:hypothetical protein
MFRDRLNPSGVYSPLTHVTAGGIAGAVAAAVTTPLDVCKTLLQTRGTSDDAQIRKARGMGDAFRIIWERQGLKGFARGLTPRILTNMPSNALCCESLLHSVFVIFGPLADWLVDSQGYLTKVSDSSFAADTAQHHHRSREINCKTPGKSSSCSRLRIRQHCLLQIVCHLSIFPKSLCATSSLSLDTPLHCFESLSFLVVLVLCSTLSKFANLLANPESQRVVVTPSVRGYESLRDYRSEIRSDLARSRC